MSFRVRCSYSLAALLMTSAALPVSAGTIGYYQFEDIPGALKDSSAAKRDLILSGAAGGQIPSPFESVFMSVSGAVNTEAMSFDLRRGFSSTDTRYADLTIEAFVELDSVDTGGVARVIAAQFGGSATTRAFNFGIAGNESGTFRADRTLFLQVVNTAGTVLNIDSGFRLTEATSYYLAVSIDAGSRNSGADGEVTFYLKDLTNGGTLQSKTIAVRSFNGFYDPAQAITIGSAGDGTGSRFHGVIDEVRLSDVALTSDELLVFSIPEPSTYDELF